eukprot:TRINITY_DN26455_c0_g1_i1.p1 TRINITY_DN26455_c0_g1~~TRINITY_DN26455_c0_g1_i1.p1  ORF type:complete len:363 (+),score=103.47 TRINITY_DN26455_c0_g1_i1:70-1158(+)
MVCKRGLTLAALSALATNSAFAHGGGMAEEQLTAAKPLRIDGMVTAVVTPFNATAAHGGVSLATERVQDQSAYLKATGVNYVFVAGTTGESLSLTLAERKELVEAWSKMPQVMIVHVGAESIEDAKALARHAKEHGAKALGCMPPVFFKPATTAVAAQWLKAVAAEAPELPLYYYHIPSMTGSNFNMLDLIKDVEKLGIPSFAGVKYTGLYETRAFMDMQQCMEYSNGKYEIFCGREEMTVQALSIGVKGFIGSQFNFVGDLYKQIREAFPSKNYLALQSHAQKLLQLELSLPAGVDGGRLAMEFAGLHMGPSRLPYISVDEDAKRAYFAGLRKWCDEGKRQLDLNLRLCGSKDASTELHLV